MLNLKISGIYTIKCENDNNLEIKFMNQGKKGKLKIYMDHSNIICPF